MRPATRPALSFETMTSPDVIARFWPRVEIRGLFDCWSWTGTTDGNGYGTLRVRDRSIGAHRIAYMLVRSLIPEGMVLDHLCRNPPCVNPAHLEPVTDRENVLRGVGPTALAAQKTHCARGHPFAGDNVRVNSNGRRFCRACGREYYRERCDRNLDRVREIRRLSARRCSARKRAA